jgi:hypothetical protein
MDVVCMNDDAGIAGMSKSSASTEEGDSRCDKDFGQLIREKRRDEGSKNFLLWATTRATLRKRRSPASIDYGEDSRRNVNQLRTEFATWNLIRGGVGTCVDSLGVLIRLEKWFWWFHGL